MNRQRLILFCLLILFVLSIIWSYSRMPRQKTAPLKFAPGKQLAPAGGSVPVVRRQGSALRLDLLDREVPDFKGYRRNIFKPVFVDEIKMAKLKVAAVKRRSLRPPPPPVPVQPVVTEMPRPELAKFTFLGFVQKGKRKIIFLSKDKEIILVKQGDIFAGRYEASSITDQALTIRVTDTHEEIVIPLVEYASLRPAG
jgi:hypothetical protein